MGFFESLFVVLLHIIAFVFDLITYIPYYFILEPKTTLELSNRLKALSCVNHPGGPYRCVEESELTTTPDEECATLDELFQKAVTLHQSSDCLGAREVLPMSDEDASKCYIDMKLRLGDYKWLPYNEVMDMVTQLGKGLAVLGMEARQNILLCGETSCEWLIAAQACFKMNFAIVTIPSTFMDEDMLFAINQTEVTHVIASRSILTKLKSFLPHTPSVKHIIYTDHWTNTANATCYQTPAVFEDTGVAVHSTAEVRQLGEEDDSQETRIEESTPLPTDIAVIMYTSGTTGQPKGVLLTHINMMSACSATIIRSNTRSTDTYIAYLPQAHILELIAEIACMYMGARIGFSSNKTIFDGSSGLADKCLGDIRTLKPTIMASVPAILDRIYKRMLNDIENRSFIKRVIYHFALRYKRKWLYRGANTPMINAFFMSSLRYQLGGNLREVLSGGAPLNPRTQEFLRLALCCPILQGYGLTETASAGTIVDPDDLSSGHTGAPVCCSMIKLVDWEEGGYSSSDLPPSGEIWIGGPSVSLGYYNNLEQTEKHFHQREHIRWFATGDIGRLRADGTIVIIDRKKDLVKLQTGEFISLGKLEAIYKLCMYIDNILLIANPEQDFTVALVKPSEKIRELAEGLQLCTEWPAICNNKMLIEKVMEEMKLMAQQNGLRSVEIPRKIKLIEEKWSPDKGLVTANMKLRRRQLLFCYQDAIQQLYAKRFSTEPK